MLVELTLKKRRIRVAFIKYLIRGSKADRARLSDRMTGHGQEWKYMTFSSKHKEKTFIL